MRLRAIAPAVAMAAALALAPAARGATGADTLGVPQRARLERAGGPLPVAGRAVAVTFTGTLDYEGHFARPHETHPYHSLRRIVVAAPGVARQDWTTWADSGSARSTETTLLVGDRALRRDDPDSAYRELVGRERDDAAFMIESAAPSFAVARALTRDGGGLAGGPRGPTLSVYSWPEPGGTMQLALNLLDLPSDWSIFVADPRRGSLSRDCRVYECSQEGERIWPDSMRTQGLPADAAWTLRERRTGTEAPTPPADLDVPGRVTPAPAPADTVARVLPVAKGVWAVELPDADTRSLAVEFARDLVLLETSCDGPHGERIRAALAARFPGKPVRTVSFSHYHPDYTGGLRPFLADSARVVCPPSLAEFVREIARGNFTLNPDRLWRLRPGGVTPRIDTLVAGRWRRADATNEIVALDIGARSNHTDAYVVFWLPRQKLLFEGDLGFFTTPAGALRASRRAAGMLQALADAGIAPVTVVQSWPVGGNAASVPFARLRELVAASSAR